MLGLTNVVTTMTGKFVRKLVRRVQFAKLVATDPEKAKATYTLIRWPQLIDPITLNGLAGSNLLKQILRSELMWTGNPSVPLQLAKHLYLAGQADGALRILRSTPGRSARMLEGEFYLYSGNLEKARAIFSAAVDRSATKAAALRNVALCQYLGGDLDSAIDTAVVGAAIYPRNMPLITFLSRVVREREEIERYFSEKLRVAKHGLSASSSAQLVRACARVGARQRGESVASDAILNLCINQDEHKLSIPAKHAATGLPKGEYSSDKGDIILQHIAAVMSGASINLFLMGGTLLGLIRDKKLLSWDKDLDFGCFAEDASTQDLWEIFLGSPYFIPMGVVSDRLIKLRHISGVTVDIFVNFEDGDTRWHGGQFAFWRDRSFPLKRVVIRDLPFYVPQDPERYLENHYGRNWRNPDPHFDVFWEAPDLFDANTEHRYLNTVAKGIQFLAAKSPENLAIRRDRARKAGAEDVAEAYQFVFHLYQDFRIKTFRSVPF